MKLQFPFIMQWLMGLIALAANTTALATTLHVKAGESRQVVLQQSEWLLDEMVLEDGSILEISGQQALQIDVAKAAIGNNVKIVAAGAHGKSGLNGRVVAGKAAECNDGGAGGDGGNGDTGGNGINLNFAMRIAQLQSLTIDARGGNGGNGGHGGSGQEAGAFQNCSAPVGGNGGKGGAGGAGGNGGHVRVFYTILPGTELKGGLADRIQILADAGKGGEGGEGGVGGVGSEGKFINMKTLGGSRKWVAGGAAGTAGVAGATGAKGNTGQVSVQQDLRDRMDQLTPTPVQIPAAAQAPESQSLQQLQETVAALKKTVDQLTAQEMVQQQWQEKVRSLEKRLQELQIRVEQLQSRLDLAEGKAR